MAETTQSKEFDKPNPVSLREYHLMDRNERKAYLDQLTRSEQKKLRVAAIVAREAQPRKVRRELANELVEKLEKRQNTSIADKVEVLLAKKDAIRLLIPEKPAIFLRKLRAEALPWPKWMIKEHTSPYLIAAH